MKRIDAYEVTYQLNALAGRMKRVADLLDRLAIDIPATGRHAREMRGAAEIALGWAAGIRQEVEK